MLGGAVSHREQPLNGGVIAKLLGLDAFILGCVVELTARDVDRQAGEEVDEGVVLEKRPLLRGPHAIRD